MTPEQWNTRFETAKPATFKRLVANATRLHLNTLADDAKIGTNELVEAIYPAAEAEATVVGFSARSAIFKAISVLAYSGLEDCCTKGEATGKKYMGRKVRPWLWFKTPIEICCMCGQIAPKDDV